MRRGFSLAEIITVVAIIAIFVAVIFSNFYNRRSYSNIKLTTHQIVFVLQEARNKAIYRYQNNDWGVYFSNSTSVTPFYSLFYSYYSTSTTVKKYDLPSGVSYSTSTIPLGGSSTIIFSQISGAASTSTKIDLISLSGDELVATSSIFINLNGVIDYNISK